MIFQSRLLLAKGDMTRKVLGSISAVNQLPTTSIKAQKNLIASLSTSTTTSKQQQQYAKHPKLPVPKSDNTLKRFLEFAQPLQTRQEFEQTKKVVASFADNELPKLQSLLDERASKLNNWLTPWWLNIAYLAARTPLPVVTSPGVLFPKLPYDGIDGQIEHAAKIGQAAVRFHLLIEHNHLPQDKAGKVPFDMSQYKFLFGTTRVPKKGCDEIVYGCSYENKPHHAVVMYQGHVYRIEVLTTNYEPVTITDLQAQLKDIVAKTTSKAEFPVGVASSANRDRWAETYENLKKNPENASNLKTIERALFVICLDQPTQPSKGYTEKDEQAKQSLHGGGSAKNSTNRWFDKTIQFVIGSNGYCGLTYEHTPAEGPPVAALMDYICDQFDKEAFEDSQTATSLSTKRLDFVLDDNDKTRIQKSTKKLDDIAADIDLIAYSFKRFGKDFPKSVKISPDSFIQMAFQLAFYRIHSAVGPTYETATLRKFDEGRTENIRSPNPLAADFVKKVTKGNIPMAELYEALRAAADSHKKYTVDCMNGAGMDRHILAWNLLAQEHNLPRPSICETSVYDHLQHFQISTSQVPTRHFIQMCFGPSAPDCYGICYNPQEKELHFTISTFKHEGSTSSKRFAKELEKALNDMRSICSKALKERAKL